MDILTASIIVFVVIETLNIGMLYFRPGSRLGNGLGVFNAYRKVEADPETGEPGYSRTLGIMIGCFVGGFAAALALSVAVGQALGVER